MVILILVCLQELSFLNSPLLSHPSISSLLSVIESLIRELSPLSQKELNSFTRSTISHGVLCNVLAHVKTAESGAVTSEEERLDAAQDWNFGPERVGDNFYEGISGNKTIDAAKLLIDFQQSEHSGTLFLVIPPDYQRRKTFNMSSTRNS